MHLTVLLARAHLSSKFMLPNICIIGCINMVRFWSPLLKWTVDLLFRRLNLASCQHLMSGEDMMYLFFFFANSFTTALAMSPQFSVWPLVFFFLHPNFLVCRTPRWQAFCVFRVFCRISFTNVSLPNYHHSKPLHIPTNRRRPERFSQKSDRSLSPCKNLFHDHHGGGPRSFTFQKNSLSFSEMSFLTQNSPNSLGSGTCTKCRVGKMYTDMVNIISIGSSMSVCTLPAEIRLRLRFIFKFIQIEF